MRTAGAVRAGWLEKVDVAELELLEADDFIAEVFGGWGIDALAFAVTGNGGGVVECASSERGRGGGCEVLFWESCGFLSDCGPAGGFIFLFQRGRGGGREMVGVEGGG